MKPYEREFPTRMLPVLVPFRGQNNKFPTSIADLFIWEFPPPPPHEGGIYREGVPIHKPDYFVMCRPKGYHFRTFEYLWFEIGYRIEFAVLVWNIRLWSSNWFAALGNYLPSSVMCGRSCFIHPSFLARQKRPSWERFLPTPLDGDK